MSITLKIGGWLKLTATFCAFRSLCAINSECIKTKALETSLRAAFKSGANCKLLASACSEGPSTSNRMPSTKPSFCTTAAISTTLGCRRTLSNSASLRRDILSSSSCVGSIFSRGLQSLAAMRCPWYIAFTTTASPPRPSSSPMVRLLRWTRANSFSANGCDDSGCDGCAGCEGSGCDGCAGCDGSEGCEIFCDFPISSLRIFRGNFGLIYRGGVPWGIPGPSCTPRPTPPSAPPIPARGRPSFSATHSGRGAGARLSSTAELPSPALLDAADTEDLVDGPVHDLLRCESDQGGSNLGV